jgi:hypothetical protein
VIPKIELAPLELGDVAKALAEKVKRDIEAQPGTRWDRTGKLKRSIAAQGDAVVVTTSDRLGDDDVRQLFASEVLDGDQTEDRQVLEAIDAALADAIRFEDE